MNPPKITVPNHVLNAAAPINVARVEHNQSLFVLDLGVITADMTAATISQRSIMTPLMAKQLLCVLHKQVVKYEKAYGEIINPAISASALPRNIVITERLKDRIN